MYKVVAKESIFKKEVSSNKVVVDRLKEDGFVVLRNFLKISDLKKIMEKSFSILKNPSLCGSKGYYLKQQKKFYDAFLLGLPAINSILNEKVIKIVEDYIDGNVFLAEAFLKKDDSIGEKYFDIHRDFSIGWGNSKLGINLTKKQLNRPIAVGAMIYLHDTKEGAFCYSKKSHKFPPTTSTGISNLPKNEKNKIMSNIIKVEGKAGDIILFDDLGFHGPHQPYMQPRSVLIFDFYSVNIFKKIPKAQIPIFINDYNLLSVKQKKMLSFHKDSFSSEDNYHIRRFKKSHSKLFSLLGVIVKVTDFFLKQKRKFSQFLK